MSDPRIDGYATRPVRDRPRRGHARRGRGRAVPLRPQLREQRRAAQRADRRADPGRARARRSSRTCSAARRRRPPSQLDLDGRRLRPRPRPAGDHRPAGRAGVAAPRTWRSPRSARPSPLTDDQQTPPRRRPGQRHRQAGQPEGRSSTRPCSAASSPPSATPSSTAPSAPASTNSSHASRDEDKEPSDMAELTLSASRHRRGAQEEPRRLRAVARGPHRRSRHRGRRRHRPRRRACPTAAVNELLEFEDGTVGLALNLDEDSIGAVVLGDVDGIEEGQTVKATGRILVGARRRRACSAGSSTPSASRSTARARSSAASIRRMEIQAPGIMGRQPVHEPLQTGIKAIDAMTPIGRGQRELIIGDRKTGKTTVAIDTIINQRGLGVKCIYVAIGQKGSTVAQTVETLRQYGAMEYTVVVAAPASRPGAVQVPRPVRRLRHGPALDGERRARPHRLRRPVQAGRGLPPGVAAAAPPAGPRGLPGRRVLPPQPPARAGRQAVSDENGAGSLTALPIIETKAGDVSAYIPTNVISITDGQVYLQDNLFKSGVRPAVDVGISVSRVGGAAQIKAMKSGVRHAEARPRPVPRARGLRHVRLRARRHLQGPARAWLPAGGAAQAAAEQPDAGRGAGGVDLRRHQGLPRRPAGQRRARASRPSCSSTSAPRYGGAARRACAPTRRPTCPPSSATLVADVQGRSSSPPVGARPRRRSRLPPTPTSVGDAESDKTLGNGVMQMAGGQERILRGRIRSVQATKKITRAMELIAASRIVKAQQRVHAAVPYSEQITEVVTDLAAAGGGVRARRCSPAATEVAPRRLRRDHRRPRPVRRLQRRRAARRRGRDQGRRRCRPATTRSSPSVARPRATSASAATTIDERVHRLHATTRPTRTPARSAEHVVDAVPRRRGRPGRARLHPLRLRRHPGGRAAAARAARARDGRRAATAKPAGRGGASGRLRVRARPGDHPRDAAAPLRRGPHLRRPAQRRGLASTPSGSGP